MTISRSDIAGGHSEPMSPFKYIFDVPDKVDTNKVISLDIESSLFINGANKTPFPVVINLACTLDSEICGFLQYLRSKYPRFTVSKSEDKYYALLLQVRVETLNAIYTLFKYCLEREWTMVTLYGAAADIVPILSMMPELADTIVDMYTNNLITDVTIREKLIAIAMDNYNVDYRLGGRPKPRYSMAELVLIYFKEKIIKESFNFGNSMLIEPKKWRIGFYLLQDVDINHWPKEAVFYAMDDAFYTIKIWEAQTNREVKYNQEGDLVYKNNVIPDEYRQARADFALHTAASVGLMQDYNKSAEFIINIVNTLKTLEPFTKLTGIKRGYTVSYELFERYVLSIMEDKEAALKALKPYRDKIFPAILEAADVDRGNKDTASKVIKGILVKCLLEHYNLPIKATKKGIEYIYKGEYDELPVGYVSTAADVLRTIPCPILKSFLDFTKTLKLVTSFVPILLRSTEIICTNPNVLVASGRTSWTNFNLQQLPSKGGFRSCFWAGLHELLNSTDYNVAELCSLAQVCIAAFGESKLAEVLNAGIDPHKVTGAALLEVDLDTFITEYEANNKAYIEARNAAKGINFGAPGGVGATTLVAYLTNYGVYIDEDTARNHIQVYKAAMPEMKKYFSTIASMVKKGPTSIVQYKSDRVRAGVIFTAACNTLFQGLTADGGKSACFELTKRMFVRHEDTPNIYGTRLVGFIHDETLTKGPRDNTKWAQEICDVQIAVMDMWTPDVKARAHPTLMVHWTKEAKEKYVDGELAAWDE